MTHVNKNNRNVIISSSWALGSDLGNLQASAPSPPPVSGDWGLGRRERERDQSCPWCHCWGEQPGGKWGRNSRDCPSHQPGPRLGDSGGWSRASGLRGRCWWWWGGGRAGREAWWRPDWWLHSHSLSIYTETDMLVLVLLNNINDKQKQQPLFHCQKSIYYDNQYCYFNINIT